MKKLKGDLQALTKSICLLLRPKSNIGAKDRLLKFRILLKIHTKKSNIFAIYSVLL
jgi:hypothetical protein